MKGCMGIGMMNKKVSVNMGELIVFGGTHGNERPGIDAVDKLFDMKLDGVRLVLTNTRAIEYNVRFVDQDLNRSFGNENILDLNKSNVELDLARDILRRIPFNRNNVVVDFHTTTSRMGNSLLLLKSKDDDFNFSMAGHIMKKVPGTKVIYMNDKLDITMISRLSSRRIAIEVGPVKHGHPDKVATELMVKTVDSIHDFCKNPYYTNCPEYFEYVSSVFFPDHEDGLIFHPFIIGMNFKPLLKGHPIFYNPTSNSIVRYDGESGLCPIFIDEESYHSNSQGIAFHLTKLISELKK